MTYRCPVPPSTDALTTSLLLSPEESHHHTRMRDPGTLSFEASGAVRPPAQPPERALLGIHPQVALRTDGAGGHCRHAAGMMMPRMPRYGPVDCRATPSRLHAPSWRPSSIDCPSACGAGCSGRGLVTADMPTHACMPTLRAVGGHGRQAGLSSGLRPARGQQRGMVAAARGRASLGARWGGGERAVAVTLRRTGDVSAVSRRWLHGGSAAAERPSAVRRIWVQAGAGASDGVDKGKRRVVAPLRDLLGEKVRKLARADNLHAVLVCFPISTRDPLP